MLKRTSAAEGTPVHLVIVTLDHHLAAAAARARDTLKADLPGLRISYYAAADWSEQPDKLERCKADIARADIVFATMLFVDEHIRAIRDTLLAHRERVDAMVCAMSSGEIMKLTRIGGFSMSGEARGAIALLKKLAGRGRNKKTENAGARQLAMLKRLPKILRFIPGKAQDVRNYFLVLQYWLAGSDDNLCNLCRLLVDRYASGDREHLRGSLTVAPPLEYPDVGLYHPSLEGGVGTDLKALKAPKGHQGTVGLLVMRSYVLAKNTAHYDGVIAALEAKGLKVVPAFAVGLDARPAIETYFRNDRGETTVDALVSLTGFSLVGGPAYNDAPAAQSILEELDVPYVAAQAVEFQSLAQWEASAHGLMPVEATIMVAIPELDGATGPLVFGGRSGGDDGDPASGDMVPAHERTEMLARRVQKLVALKQSARADRKLAVVLFNFPPNAGAIGTAAFLSVFQSLFNTLKELRSAGYHVDLPESVEALRAALLTGNSEQYGTEANVAATISAQDYIRSEPHLADIEAQWGTAPGKHQSDGRSLFVLGAHFGNVFVGLQPAFGYEGDPMRLLFERSFAPTHAFAAFYGYLKREYCADAVLHFGTHGALEFMPGKQVGMSEACWPDRLIGDLPNIYLYAANNPSEGTIAKRRAAATLVSYLTPPVTKAGLYKGLIELKSTLERWRGLVPEANDERARLAPVIQAQAANLDLADAEPLWSPGQATKAIDGLTEELLEFEYALIPHGLHVLGEAPAREARVDLLAAIADAGHNAELSTAELEAIVDGLGTTDALNATNQTVFDNLTRAHQHLTGRNELDGLLAALDGRFVSPGPGGDLLRSPDMLPTGRNIHGFDPFRLPSLAAMIDGAEQAERLLARHARDDARLPESVAIVLWGTDNLKTEGGPIGQALALIGAKPRFDAYGRLAGAELVPLEDVARPRIDVVLTLSGIFRDLLPFQTKLLAEACLLAASADEPVEQNFIRKHALAYMAETGADLETAALRVFSNADGAYGSNVNQLIDAGNWSSEDELAETFSRRKCFAYGCKGKPVEQKALMGSLLKDVDLAYQNLESVEVGITTIDHYFDTLGGISRAVTRAKGDAVPVYIGDQTTGSGKVRTLSEQVALEARTRVLNPRWYEGLLEHGYEGVHQIEAHVTNTMGWSATTGQVAPWVYTRLSETFVLDPEMRKRLSDLNPAASVKLTGRLLEAHERQYWEPDEETLSALRSANDELEDRLEGVREGEAVA